jgi:maltose-binding protein MalE
MIGLSVTFRRHTVGLALAASCLIATACNREEWSGVKSARSSRESQGRHIHTLVMWNSGENMNYLPDIVTRFNEEQHTTASVFPDGTKQAIHPRLMSINSGTIPGGAGWCRSRTRA